MLNQIGSSFDSHQPLGLVGVDVGIQHDRTNQRRVDRNHLGTRGGALS